MNDFFKVLFYLLIVVYMNGCSSIQCKGVSTKEEAKKAIVKITSKNSEGTKQTGTGFVIAKQPNGKKVYIVTAAHVVMGDSNPKIKFFSQTSSFYEAEYKLWEQSDVAVLWLDDLPPDIFSQLHTLCISKVDLEAGNEVFTYGFPEEEWHRHKKMDFELSKENTYIFGGNIKPGFSGAPLLLKREEKFQVVAMINEKGPTGEVIATPAQILLYLIKQLDPRILKWMDTDSTSTIPSTPPKPSGGRVPKPIELKPSKPVKLDIEPEMVPISSAFQMSQYEITLKKYKQYCKNNCPEFPTWLKDNMPVVNVSWNDAVAYTKWLSQKTGKTYRLPTGMEWTLAAQGGRSGSTDYFWGYDSSKACQYANANTKKFSFGCQDKHSQLAPVKSYEPNEFDLYHILGNVAEWTSDCPNEIKCKIRGGSWKDGPQGIRIDREGFWHPKRWSEAIGFRVLQK